jgi:hypothetical protein
MQKRRALLAAVGIAAISWALPSLAQRRVWRIGVLETTALAMNGPNFDALRKCHALGPPLISHVRPATMRQLLLAIVILAAGLADAQAQSSRVTIYFGSVCCGPDMETLKSIKDAVRAAETRYGRKIRQPTEVPLAGLEGEFALCYTLNGLTESQRKDFVKKIRSTTKSAPTVRVGEGVRCPRPNSRIHGDTYSASLRAQNSAPHSGLDDRLN